MHRNCRHSLCYLVRLDLSCYERDFGLIGCRYTLFAWILVHRHLAHCSFHLEYFIVNQKLKEWALEQSKRLYADIINSNLPSTFSLLRKSLIGWWTFGKISFFRSGLSIFASALPGITACLYSSVSRIIAGDSSLSAGSAPSCRWPQILWSLPKRNA